jgi:EmrB/QacA subfamily drug resistance transporter
MDAGAPDCHTPAARNGDPVTSSQRWTMLAAVLGSAMVFLDGTVMNLALPRIGRELPATLVSVLEGQTYAVSGYLAILAALLILAGALADFHGRRKVFAIGLVGFGISSVLCAIAPTLELLVSFRLLQGATGALLVPGSLAIITALFEGQARARAFGIWAAATSATSLIGPVVGGLLVDEVSWRAAFLINVPLVALALWATLRHMPETRAENASGSFDWLGAGVIVLAVGGLAFGTIRGQDRQWEDPLAWASLAVGVVALVAFPFLMARRPNPLVPLGLFRRRRFATINLSTLLIYGALYTILTFQGLFLQGTVGYSATAAGVIGLPMGLLLTVLSTRVGAMAGRIGARPFLVTGPALMAGGLLWLARVPATTQPWRLALADPATWAPPPSVLIDILPTVLLFGIGISLVVAPLTTTLMGSVPVSNAGLASAINNSISRIGQPLLSALIFLVVSGAFYASLAGAVPGLDPTDPATRALVQPLNPPGAAASPALVNAAREASVQALHLAAAACALLLLAGSLTNWVGLRPSAGEGGRELDPTSTDRDRQSASVARDG